MLAMPRTASASGMRLVGPAGVVAEALHHAPGEFPASVLHRVFVVIAGEDADHRAAGGGGDEGSHAGSRGALAVDLNEFVEEDVGVGLAKARGIVGEDALHKFGNGRAAGEGAGIGAADI